MFSVKSLRDNGFMVRVTHKRLYCIVDNYTQSDGVVFTTPQSNLKFLELSRFESPGLQFALPNGGKTIVEVTDKSGQTFVAESVCSTNDAFNKRRGVQICLGRLIKHLV